MPHDTNSELLLRFPSGIMARGCSGLQIITTNHPFGLYYSGLMQFRRGFNVAGQPQHCGRSRSHGRDGTTRTSGPRLCIICSAQ
eukprot:COSAG01_NODE_70_length_28755_cov_34.709067_14_plen_84_part_00